MEIYNDSHLYSHHKAMQGVTSKETHFRMVITSKKVKAAKMKPSYTPHGLRPLKNELAQEGGIHALQLKTRTPEVEERQNKKEQAKQ